VPRTATAAEIKKARRHPHAFLRVGSLAPCKAYYALAKQYHPDANKAADAEQRFQEIQKAYETLKDEQQRSVYDAVGHDAFGRQGGGGGGGGGQGNPFQGFQGGAGFGGFPFGGGNMDPADMENIFGQLFGGRAGGRRDMSVTVTLELLDVLRGCSRTVDAPKAGGGRQPLELRIPPGMEDGVAMQVADVGVPGGGRFLVRVAVKCHPVFARDGQDLSCELPLPLHVAVLGGVVRVPRLDPKEGHEELKVAPGTQPGDVVRLRGRGLPQPDRPASLGDLFVRWVVRVPRSVTARQRQLLEEYAEIERTKG